MITNPPAVGERADFERDPHHREEASGCRGGGCGERGPEMGAEFRVVSEGVDGDFGQSACEENGHEPSAEGRRRGGAEDRVEHPSPAGGRSGKARPDEFGAGAHGDRGDRGAGARAGAENPGRWCGREEQGGEPEDDHQPGDDEGDATDDRAGDASDPPGRKYGELGRRRSW